MSLVTEVSDKLGVADILQLWGQYEATKQNIRFLELTNQNKALESASVSQNAQAGATVKPAQSFSDWVKANPMLAAGAGLGLAAMVWMAVK